MLDICLLGTGGMLPLPDRYLTAMLARFNGRKLLIDCGEGTQVTMRLLGWGYKTLDVICFTHYHGDHVTGLPGLLLTLNNTGRVEPLTIIGPPGLRKIVEGLTVVSKDISFELNLIELPYEKQTLQVGEFHITALPVPHNVKCFAYVIENHRLPKFMVEKAKLNHVPQKVWKLLQQGQTVEFEGPHNVKCFAYVIENHRLPKFMVEKAKLNHVPQKVWKLLQQGQTVEFEGKRYTPDMVLGDQRKGIKVAYSTDCRPTQDLEEAITEADLFICEGMYTDDSYLAQVKKHKHMLASEAALLAKKAKVKELWLTHFSPALPTSYISIEEVKKIFPQTIAGKDRMTKTIEFS